MNMYLVSQEVNDGYDTYDSAVVSAESEADARIIHPSDYLWHDGAWQRQDIKGEWYKEWGAGTWAEPDAVTVRRIGRSTEPRGVVLASFNAG